MSDVYAKEWRIAECGTGRDCWCRLVATVDYDPTFKGKNLAELDEHEKEIIIGSGEIGEVAAAHIVKCHNLYLKHKKSTKEMLKNQEVKDGQIEESQ